MINALIVKDSLNPYTGIRLTTFLLTYPRFIHSEFMTHRVFSRNAASSRAIPVERMLQIIRDNPAMPVHWGTNKPGMQAGAPLEDESSARALWLNAMYSAVGFAAEMAALGVHKQIVNRLVEPFAHIQVVVTATEYANFFALRSHPDAQPEIQRLSDEMLRLYTTEQPKERWRHLPFVSEQEELELPAAQAVNASVARCARVSYARIEQLTTAEQDTSLVQRLQTGGHWSPFEHVATAQRSDSTSWIPGNFRSWLQHRHTFADDRPHTNLYALAKSRGVS